MSFSAGDANVKLKAPDEKNYAVAALSELARNRATVTVTGDMPQSEGETEGHVQGVALRGDYSIQTTSARDGFVMVAQRKGTEYALVSKQQVEHSRHPGGIQTIGDYVVVPGYQDARQILFYRLRDGSLEKQDQLTLATEIDGKCVGITNCSQGENEFYVLAVCDNERVVHFYRSNPGKPLSSGECAFDPRPTKWDIGNVSSDDRADWRPDKKWRGYPNSISLLADEAGTVYFLGLRRTRLFFGKDLADLFKLDIDASEPKMLTKLSSFHARCRNRTSFRWGGSALVTSPTRLRIFACERNVWSAETTKTTNVNVFRAGNDPLHV